MSTDQVRVYRFDASGCNGCDVSIVEMTVLAPLDRLGIQVADSPEEASVLLITGGTNRKSARALADVHGRIREPRRVVAIGSCATTMGVFKGGYPMAGPVDGIVPVDLYIGGCPPRPQALLRALAEALRLPLDSTTPLALAAAAYRGAPQVDAGKCMGCGACAHVCPADAIEIRDEGGQRLVCFKRGDCIFCATCQDACPSQAIQLAPADQGWFTDRRTTAPTAVALAACPACGTVCVSPRQIDWVMRKLDETLDGNGAARAGVQRGLALCPACRRSRITEVTAAKRLLAAMAKVPAA
ncbi:MAG TPA: 4Fe-4S dicluster domain-containing protein [Candidatus Sulfotelmatobacter sp.]|nr:4Fe-4S dicluster domain-containing protein [Candidatus Sulfotelmatobacter sp.]